MTRIPFDTKKNLTLPFCSGTRPLLAWASIPAVWPKPTFASAGVIKANHLLLKLQIYPSSEIHIESTGLFRPGCLFVWLPRKTQGKCTTFSSFHSLKWVRIQDPYHRKPISLSFSPTKQTTRKKYIYTYRVESVVLLEALLEDRRLIFR